MAEAALQFSSKNKWKSIATQICPKSTFYSSSKRIKRLRKRLMISQNSSSWTPQNINDKKSSGRARWSS